MAIDSIRPNPGAASPYEPKIPPSAPAPASAARMQEYKALKPPIDETDKIQASKTGPNQVVSEQAAAQETADKPAQSLRGKSLAQSVEQLQALAEKLKQNQAQMQAEYRMATVDQAMAATQQELRQAQQEAWHTSLLTDGESAGYWDPMEVQDKAALINRLKEKIQQLASEREQLVENVKQQVQQGSYRVSGAEILKGMMQEFF